MKQNIFNVSIITLAAIMAFGFFITLDGISKKKVAWERYHKQYESPTADVEAFMASDNPGRFVGENK